MRSNVFVFLILVLSASILFSGCGVSDSETNEYSKWTFSGYVVDGAENKGLSGAEIAFLDDDGNTKTVLTDSTGAFYIENIPYGTRSFRFSYLRVTTSGKTQDTLYYGERILNVGSTTESSAMEGVVANGSRIVKLFPLNAALKGDLYLILDDSELKVPAESVQVSLQYLDTTFVNNAPSNFLAVTDSLGRFSFANLPADSNWAISFAAKTYGGRRYVADAVTLPALSAKKVLDIGRAFMNVDTLVEAESFVVASNVLDADGLGLKNISPMIVPYFVMAKALDAANLSVSLTYNDTAFLVNPILSGDTLFLRHDLNLPAERVFSVDIYGYTKRTRERVHVLLDSTSRFETGKGLYVTSSNTWNTSGKYRSSFAQYDTLWVCFSEALNTDASGIAWAAASKGQETLYGSGVTANATTWIHGDTLFVRPDQRLSAESGDSVGFNVTVSSKSGLTAENVEIYSKYVPETYSVLWTNTLSLQGEMREDLRIRDTVYIVSAEPIDSIVGFSISDTSAALPSGIQRKNISLRGDTIVFVPSVALVPGILYGLDFDVRTPEGRTVYNVLGVEWKTAYQVSVLSVNNQSNGIYRVFKSVGDSLVVSFSEAIDTSVSATVPFHVNMSDVNGNIVQTDVAWNKTRTVATIKNVTPLPTANFGAAPGNSNASSALAVSAVTFDLTTSAGEIAQKLTLSTSSVYIYTEQGLCPVNSNAVKGHSSSYELTYSETARADFPLDSAVTVTFNRALDTTYMKQTGLSDFVLLENKSGDTIAVTYSFSKDAKSIYMKPKSALTAKVEYRIYMDEVPALGIRNADAIDDHGGTYSGKSSTSSYLLTAGFSGL